jgi:hypothetical protein
LPFVLVFAILFTLVVGPIKIHQSQWTAIDAEKVPIDPEGPEMPREVVGHYREAVARLTPLRFRPVLSYSRTKLVPNALGFSTLFRNDATSEVATLLTVFAFAGVIRNKVSLLIFRTEFADGTEVVTSNSNSPSAFPPLGPPVYVFGFPQIRDPIRLHAIHQAVVDQFERGVPRRDPIGDDPDAYLLRVDRRQFDHQVACGYYYLDQTGRVQRPTWKGAILMTLKLVWPVKPLRQLCRRWKAARMLRELDVA